MTEVSSTLALTIGLCAFDCMREGKGSLRLRVMQCSCDKRVHYYVVAKRTAPN